AWPPAGKPGPLSGAVTGPGCRAQREERVLAWLLQHDGPAGEALRLLQPRAFSTYARCEIHLAWQQAAATAAQAGGAAPPPGEVRHQLARRLLRAPAWADHAVGWPLGHHALAYHDRLAATPITAPQAESAARTLLQEDTTPADQAPEATVAPSRPARSARPGQAQSAQPGPRAPAPRRPGDPMPPTGPRM
ncbi:MAG: hypothetical protein J2P25_18510, partial [Nocardiopsaceae bacterium]|nr:hypothetical protein [Nocardiopsaceae bacterium]